MDKVLKKIPYYTEVSKNSYLEMYLDLMEALDCDHESEENPLITYQGKPNFENGIFENVFYEFYINGLRKVVLEELLNKINFLDASAFDRDLANLSRHSNQYGEFARIISAVNNTWDEKVKYNHQQL